MAPRPAPAEWLRELMRHAYGVRFSPAGPMVATHAVVPSTRLSVSVAARVPMPHTKEASLIFTSPSLMLRYTGASDAPSRMMAS